MARMESAVLSEQAAPSVVDMPQFRRGKMDRALTEEALNLVEALRSARFAAAVRQNESRVTRLERLMTKALDRYERRWKKTVRR